VTYERKSIGDLPWTVMIMVPITAFFTGIRAAAGADAYKVLKRLVIDIWTASRGPDGYRGVTILRDRESGDYIILEPDLPDEAYATLAEADPSDTRDGVLKYDRRRKHWTAPS
jgi:hypothetical protein